MNLLVSLLCNVMAQIMQLVILTIRLFPTDSRRDISIYYFIRVGGANVLSQECLLVRKSVCVLYTKKGCLLRSWEEKSRPENRQNNISKWLFGFISSSQEESKVRLIRSFYRSKVFRNCTVPLQVVAKKFQSTIRSYLLVLMGDSALIQKIWNVLPNPLVGTLCFDCFFFI